MSPIWHRGNYMARNKFRASNKEANANRKLAEKQAKIAKKNAELLYKEQIKAMRPYLKKLNKIDLRKKINSGNKSFVTKAWNQYSKLTARGHTVYKPKSKDKLKAAQKYARHGLDKSAPIFDVAFIPTALDKPKVKVDKSGRVSVGKGFVQESAVYFDIEELVINPEKEIQRILDENKDSTQFILMAGEYTVNGGLDRGTFKRETLYWINRYSPGGEGYNRRGANSYFSNWLLGAIVVETSNQKDFQQWLKAFKNKSDIQKVQKKRQRDKMKRKYGAK